MTCNALYPGPKVIKPWGWVVDPQRYSPSMGVLYWLISGVGRLPMRFSSQIRPTIQSPFFGQDQETGEIIDFRANFKNGRQATGGTHSVVDSEGWDEVPEHVMFGFRARNAKRNQSGLGPVKPNQVNSPRDAASGLPSGKRQ